MSSSCIYTQSVLTSSIIDRSNSKRVLKLSRHLRDQATLDCHFAHENNLSYIE